MDEIRSESPHALTTAGLAEFRNLLQKARLEHRETAGLQQQAISHEAQAVGKYDRWRNGWLLRRLFTRTFARLHADATEATARRAELDEQERLAKLSTVIEMPTGIKASFAKLTDAFRVAAASNRVWDTVSHRATDRFAERTLASREVEIRPVNFGLGQCPVLDSDWQVPHLPNANGGDIYLYPGFVVFFESESSFALLEAHELELDVKSTRFHEEDHVPHDAEIVGRTWKKCNKDGTPDRRFKDNYEIPVVRYGLVSLRSKSGMNEEYMLSNANATIALGEAWLEYRKATTGSRPA